MKDFGDLTIAHWHDDFKVTNMEGDTSLYADSSDGYAREYFTIDNPEEQDVFVSCEKLLERMFPKGLPTCKEEPVNFWFHIYKKYSPYVSQQKDVI